MDFQYALRRSCAIRFVGCGKPVVAVDFSYAILLFITTNTTK